MSNENKLNTDYSFSIFHHTTGIYSGSSLLNNCDVVQMAYCHTHLKATQYIMITASLERSVSASTSDTNVKFLVV